MYLLSRIKVHSYIAMFVCIFWLSDATAQVDLQNPRTISGGSRTYNANITSNTSCPNTIEYIPANYDFNDKTKKYPLIICLPGFSEMIQPAEDLNLAVQRLLEQNIYLNAGVHLNIERGEFPSSVSFGGNTFQFIVVSIQCNKDVNEVENLPAQIDWVLSNYILNNKFSGKIDLNRIYMTGTSRGGGLIWEFMEDATRAKKIAAISPIAGGTRITSTEPQNLVRFQNVITNILGNPFMGVYAAHNVNDLVVNYRVTDSFATFLNQSWPGRAFINGFTSTESPYHNAWTRALNAANAEFFNNSIYQWMLSYSLAEISALPVTLTSFDAYAKGSVVELNWNTASESNSAYFAVERSSNGQDWKEIGRVKASGNSATAKSYKFTDTAPLSGNNYYRLKMVDLDASFKLSEMRKVGMNGSDLEFSFGPNPVINEAAIRISGNQRTRLTVTVTDLMGRTLKSLSFSKTENLLTQKINLAELPAGQYILSVKGDNVNYTQRIMKR